MRISVAAIAPTWKVLGGDSLKVAVLNDTKQIVGPGGSPVHHASAFGGAVVLQEQEIKELERFAIRLDRRESRDARLTVADEAIEDVLSWFLARGPERWMSDVAREIKEEALLEGIPVFDSDLFSSLTFTFERVVRVHLGATELRSAAAAANPTLYQWWTYSVQCSSLVIAQLQRSERIILPTEEQIAARIAGKISLSANLVNY